MTDFAELGLIKPLLNALDAKQYTKPTPIQEQAIPVVLEGKDLLGLAQTGTGKTAAFSLPLIQRLNESRYRASPRGVRALILSPTRELSDQIHSNIKAYSGRLPMHFGCVVGGVPIGPQVKACQRGIDILVATPGRLMDLYRRNAVHFDDLEIFVLDEADQMLDLGFFEILQELADLLPPERQTLFFSATMPKPIAALSKRFLRNPVEVKVAPAATTVETVTQKIAHLKEEKQKQPLLIELLNEEGVESALVFAGTRERTAQLAGALAAQGIDAQAIHGDMDQAERQKTLDLFKRKRIKVLVATDVAARGIDVTGISRVINFDMPNVTENYVHRIGRTARAGRDGEAISLCLPEERGMLRAIENLTRQKIEVLEGYPWFKSDSEPKSARTPKFQGKGGKKGSGQGKAKSGSGQFKPTGNKPSGPKGGAKKPSQPPRRSRGNDGQAQSAPSTGAYLKRK
ncbi:DEAD/DEAH box helicase [Rhodobacteraceae bacterium RKSG542]|nr:DEAD/DEAH box helicase [Pseudovibrio flavus]MTI18539.1 DEAD/DEAH box helicase [Pseudovibrio flavus]